MPDPNVLNGYEWRKAVDGNLDILQWRYRDSEKIKFETTFTTYRYDINTLIQHFNRLDFQHECILTEWGCNGLSDKGNRFIGLAGRSKKGIPLEELREKVLMRNEKLWSDNEMYKKSNLYKS
ncbi:MAG: hypothetical protein F6K35_51825 [Okeania sp. SIO2H7]|nr:hypothetical protein [Okeania sp. SIO2H7]